MRFIHDRFDEKLTISQNKTTQPISLSDIKQSGLLSDSIYASDIENTAKYDKKIEDAIKTATQNWESETKYILFDTTFEGYFSQALSIDSFEMDVLNFRTVESFQYLPQGWELGGAYTTLDFTTNPLTIYPETQSQPTIINLKEELLLSRRSNPNKVKVLYKAGFANNNFTNLKDDIKDALIKQTIIILEKILGLESCNDIYIQSVAEAYKKYKILPYLPHYINII